MQRLRKKKPVSLGRHRRACTICAHPERFEIEQAFVTWASPAAAHAGEVNQSVSRASQARLTPGMWDVGAMWEQMSRGLCDVRIGQRCVI
jgi:hypothetical protein